MFSHIGSTLGYYISSESNSAFEAVELYDAYDRSDLDCGITTANANKSCVISIDIHEELEPPILIHYEIENFHQNHRAYQQSRDDKQVGSKCGYLVVFFVTNIMLFRFTIAVVWVNKTRCYYG